MAFKGGMTARRVGALALVAALTACGGNARREATATPRTVAIASFTADVDPATGTIAITPIGGDVIPAGLVYFTGYQQIPVVRNATWGSPAAGTVEARNAGTPATLTDGCGPGNDSFEGLVEIHSGSRLRNVYVQLWSISQAGHASCKSWPQPGLSAGIDETTGGLFRYGDIARGGSATALWSFQLPGRDTTPFSFQGRIMAEYAEEDPPVTTATVVTTGSLPNNAVQLACADGTGSGCADTWFSVDGAATTAYTQPVRLSGTQTLCYQSVDVAGNVEAARCTAYTVAGAALEEAQYSAALGAVRCTSVTRDCFTGENVYGVGNATGGAEPNQPNTLDTCQDATTWPYGTAESVDRFHLATVSGGPLMAGAQVRVTADVVGWTGDTVDVFTATTTVNPTWEWVQAARVTIPDDVGFHTIVTGAFPLPPGTAAVRVAATDVPTYVNGCGTSSNADMDDMAIVLNAPPPGPAAPTVAITSPAGGATVSRTVRVVVTASDDVAVTQAELFVASGTTTGFESRGVDTAPPWVFAWDTTLDLDAAQVFVEVRDADGNATQSDLVTLTVVDETPPETLSLTAPAAGSYAAGAPITLGAYALDNQTGVWEVEWFADGYSLGTDSVGAGNNYGRTWTPGATWVGVHSIWARARDVAGNYAQTAPVQVTITP